MGTLRSEHTHRCVECNPSTGQTGLPTLHEEFADGYETSSNGEHVLHILQVSSDFSSFDYSCKFQGSCSKSSTSTGLIERGVLNSNTMSTAALPATGSTKRRFYMTICHPRHLVQSGRGTWLYSGSWNGNLKVNSYNRSQRSQRRLEGCVLHARHSNSSHIHRQTLREGLGALLTRTGITLHYKEGNMIFHTPVSMLWT